MRENWCDNHFENNDVFKNNVRKYVEENGDQYLDTLRKICINATFSNGTVQDVITELFGRDDSYRYGIIWIILACLVGASILFGLIFTWFKQTTYINFMNRYKFSGYPIPVMILKKICCLEGPKLESVARKYLIYRLFAPILLDIFDMILDLLYLKKIYQESILVEPENVRLLLTIWMGFSIVKFVWLLLVTEKLSNMSDEKYFILINLSALSLVFVFEDSMMVVCQYYFYEKYSYAGLSLDVGVVLVLGNAIWMGLLYPWKLFNLSTRLIKLLINNFDDYKWFLLSPFYVLIFVLFHTSRLYGSQYQLFNETERYHPGDVSEEGLYKGGVNPACVDIDANGQLIKNLFSTECLQGVDYAIVAFFGIASVLSLTIMFNFGIQLIANSQAKKKERHDEGHELMHEDFEGVEKTFLSFLFN